MRKWFIIVLGLISTSIWANWVKVPVGNVGSWVSDLACGWGRNDGINRLYTGGWNDQVEFTWNGTSWSKLQIDMANGWGIVIGEGRNDGIIRLYASGLVRNPQRAAAFEYTWNGSSWEKDTIAIIPWGPSSGAGHGIAIEDGRNDDTVRVYFSDCNNCYTYECTWNGSSWNTIKILDDCATEMILAQGRGDNIYRLYLSRQGDSLVEYTWAGGNWESMNIDPSYSCYYDVCIGEGRSDGVTRIYSGRGGSNELYEFTWNGNNWDKQEIGTMPNLPRCVVVGIGCNDGVNRVYSGTTGTRYASEFSWTGTQWSFSNWLDNTGTSSVAYHGRVIADARNDGVQRVYMGSSDEYVYEFTCEGSSIEEEETSCSEFSILEQNWPNPFYKFTEIRYSIPVNELTRVKIKIYDLSGNLVKDLVDNLHQAGTYKIIWDGRDEFGKSQPAGIYFYTLEIGKFRTTKKLGILR